MAFEAKATLLAIQGYLTGSGHITGGAMVGEPKSPPEGGVSGAVYMSDMSVVGTTLSDTIEMHVVTVRLYFRLFQDPLSDAEFKLAEVVSKVASDLMGEFDLGASIRNIDVAGQHGTPVSAEWGHIDVGGVMFRTVDVRIPLIVDGSTTLAP